MWKTTLTIALTLSALGSLCLAEAASETISEPGTCDSSFDTTQTEAGFPAALGLAGNEGEMIMETGPCTATLNCQDGRPPISCTSTSTSPKACNSTPRNCPSWRGSVSCKVGSLVQTTYCEDPCPPTHCPDTPGCTYQYYTATGCCVAVNPAPGTCPTICE